MEHWLGPRLTAPWGRGDTLARVREDLRRCVVFLGTEAKGQHEINAAGTGFQIHYDGFSYLVTAGHVAEELGSDPFVIRVNERLTGKGTNFHIDGANWYFHPQYPHVDLAVLEGEANSPTDDIRLKYDYTSLADDFILHDDKFTERKIGTGDRAHVVGLFRLLHGKERNIPVVHTGWIAMVPGDEPIPVKHRKTGKTIYVNGYLVEAQTLEGLSGSPVFVEQTVRIKVAEGHVANLDTNVALLGIWQGAWDAPPDEVRSTSMAAAGLRVPVGMGIVVPSKRLTELLEMDKLKAMRDTVKAQIDAARAANADSAPVSPPPTKGGNPQHREDFNQLLDAAVKSPKSDG